ncbi:glutaminase [Aliiroseovarius sediminis]|uniref:glutaminase n=1 Tax=Aliiroseovarius sediminis TaxID=2925839 RepID=UPI001F55F630|nr:glutaminase [Aliiroseovarius sediminis]MCI2393960.1 glutaminase [Aliiroseovarius sediminis]
MALLEQKAGRPLNPFINADALVTTNTMLTVRPPSVALSDFSGFVRAGSQH